MKCAIFSHTGFKMIKNLAHIPTRICLFLDYLRSFVIKINSDACILRVIFSLLGAVIEISVRM